MSSQFNDCEQETDQLKYLFAEGGGVSLDLGCLLGFPFEDCLLAESGGIAVVVVLVAVAVVLTKHWSCLLEGFSSFFYRNIG